MSKPIASGRRSSRVCVLGGTGFVGRSLLALLIRRGYAIIVPTRDRSRHRDLWVLPGVDLVEADVHDETALTKVLGGSDAAVNLIGILNESGHDGAGFMHAHLALAEKLARACRGAGVGRLLQMSALKADAELGPSHYLRSKGLAENAIAQLCGADVAYTIFRPSVIFGAEDSFTNRFAQLLRWLPVLPLPCAQARFAPVFVEDVAHAFAAALEDSDTHGRTYELCGPDIYSLGEVVSLIAWTLGVQRVVIPLPAPLGRLQAWLGEYLLPGKPFSIDNFRSLGVASVCGEHADRALFGIRPQSLTTILPTYLGGASRQGRLARLRQRAGR